MATKDTHVPEEEVDDLSLLDGECMKVHLLDVGNLALLNEAAEFGHRDPLLGLISTATSTTTAASTTTTTSTITASVLGESSS